MEEKEGITENNNNGVENMQKNVNTQNMNMPNNYNMQYQQNNSYNQSNQGNTQEFKIPEKYRPISAWGYFGYNLLFALPLAGLILLIVFSFDNSNINRRNYARSFFCALLIIAIIVSIFIGLGLGTYFSLRSWIYDI